MTSLTWIIIALVCGAIEIFTVGFWFLYLAIAALAVALAVSIGWLAQIEAQLLIFALLTILLVIFTRPLIMKLVKTNETASNVQALVGQKGICVDEIIPLHSGQIKVNGEIWTAAAAEEIEAGTLVEVTAVEGVKLIVKKAD